MNAKSPRCERRHLFFVTLVTVLLAVTGAAGCAPQLAAPPGAAIANPASQNCGKQGGKLQIEQRPDGGQFGVCNFEDNRQCEEWALLRGECPAGGVKVTGYVTPAARYCAITGGTYAVTAEGGQPGEKGTCTLKDGRRCDATAFFEGTCTS